jgi:hypothetical protein
MGDDDFEPRRFTDSCMVRPASGPDRRVLEAYNRELGASLDEAVEEENVGGFTLAERPPPSQLDDAVLAQTLAQLEELAVAMEQDVEELKERARADR